ncbi:MAG TPA: glycosyltransferase family 4 protein, partial [Chloroflexota bacterium]|nr:glycosyltransferase family 4 protein [Chloroflexota bacterium]
ADKLAPTYGWGRYAIGLIEALRHTHLDFRLLTPKHLCAVPELAALPGHGTVTSFVSETRRLSKLTLSNALVIRRAAVGCDVVHCITEPYAIPAALTVGGRPLVVTLHGTYAVRPFTRPGERWWYEVAYRRAARLCPVSGFTRSLLPPRFRDAPKTCVVPEGVDVERFRACGGAAAHEDPPFLLSVGPIKRRKGYAATIEAFAHVHAARPDVQYWIAGGTDDRVFLEHLRRRIGELGLGEAVRLLGTVSDEELASLYRRCAAFWLLPVDDDLQFEGFGLVYWEALASGRPAIGARRSGAEDAIEDGVTGYLVEAHDPVGAARAALALLNDPARAAQMGGAGRLRVRPWEDAAQRYLEEYEALAR